MKPMEHLFVPYNIALMAKEKGFNEPCFAKYVTSNKDFIVCGALFRRERGYMNSNSNSFTYITAPLYQQIIDWLRENYCIHVTYDPCTGWKLWDITETVRDFFVTDTCTYYEALNTAITEAFKLLIP